jgi:hypothetical protein
MNRRKIFICNDVGATEQISNLIKYKKIKNYSTILSNTSKKIFIKNKVKINPTNKDNIHKYNIIITGTSWRFKNEIETIKEFAGKKKIITILDEVIHAKRRFRLDNKYFFPDEIWVPKKIIVSKKNFSNKVKIKKIPNYYFLDFKKKLSKLKLENYYRKNFLYLTQPNSKVNKSMGKKTYKDEKYFLNKFLTKLSKYSLKNSCITLRVHPSEQSSKYNKIINNFNNLSIKNSKLSLEKDLKKHFFVVGYNTNAMRLASLNRNMVITMGGKKVIKDFFYNKDVNSFNFFSKQLEKFFKKI